MYNFLLSFGKESKISEKAVSTFLLSIPFTNVSKFNSNTFASATRTAKLHILVPLSISPT